MPDPNQADLTDNEWAAANDAADDLRQGIDTVREIVQQEKLRLARGEVSAEPSDDR